jgi:hypothetical protein
VGKLRLRGVQAQIVFGANGGRGITYVSKATTIIFEPSNEAQRWPQWCTRMRTTPHSNCGAGSHSWHGLGKHTKKPPLGTVPQHGTWHHEVDDDMELLCPAPRHACDRKRSQPAICRKSPVVPLTARPFVCLRSRSATLAAAAIAEGWRRLSQHMPVRGGGRVRCKHGPAGEKEKSSEIHLERAEGHVGAT